jgi:hypothetical protein
MTKKLLAKRQSQRERGRDDRVTLAFHYTAGSGLGSIGEHGLLTKADRDGGKIKGGWHGAVFGDGWLVVHLYYLSCILCLCLCLVFTSTPHLHVFAPGVYVANNPDAFAGYGL